VIEWLKRKIQMLEWLNRIPRPLVLFGGLILVGAVGLLDYLTGYEISFSIFYIIPIVLVTWTISRRAGVALALLGAVIWYLVEYLGGRPYSNPVIPYWNALVRLSFFLIIAFSLAALRELWRKEKDLSRVDFLTGIANSKAFYESAEQEIERSSRYRRPLSLAYLDCDNFKEINDRLGHQSGDNLLRKVADIIKTQLRSTDIGARLGGDEFAVLLPETGEAAAQEVVARLKDKLSEGMQRRGWPVTFSVGLVTFADPPASVDEMVSRADTLMYAAKKNGKDQIKKEAIG